LDGRPADQQAQSGVQFNTKGGWLMTKLEQAFAEAAKLPPADQESLAAVIMAELESEARWKKALANSAGGLEALAREALDEHQASQTVPLDPKQL
jgi:hypothetical protein